MSPRCCVRRSPHSLICTGAMCCTRLLSSWAACTTSTSACQVRVYRRVRSRAPPHSRRITAGRNDDPLLFVKVLQRRLADMALTNAAAHGRLFSAMRVLNFFADDPRSGVVADDAELFCKLQSELQRGSSAAPVFVDVKSGGHEAGATQVAGGVGGLPAGN